MFGIKPIIKLFRSGNVSVSGLRGTGKDMLTGNVIVRRKEPYISNVNYGGKWIPLDFNQFHCGNNTYRNFISGKVKRYVYPYDDGIDIYASDLGVVAPSQYNGELNRDFGNLPVFMALSRQLGECNFHYNTQNLNRVWDKVREQSDLYIRCINCRVLFGKLVIQRVILYERYQSAVDRIPPYKPPKVLISPDRKFQIEQDKQRYHISHGVIEPKLLIYFNKSSYNTRIYKEMLENGSEC